MWEVITFFLGEEVAVANIVMAPSSSICRTPLGLLTAMAAKVLH